jgi:filamentous hemagglutinin family protein
MNRRARSVRILAIALFGLPTSASAQVVFDDSLGAPGAAPLGPGGTIYQIEADRGATVSGGGRTHLFFSFEQFDVETSRTAEFRPGADVDAIVSRVTGGSPSRIDGGLRVQALGGGAGPDLFLLNPDGVLFGGTTRLDLGGELYVSTASGVGFEDGGFFSALDVDAALPSSAAAPGLLRFDGTQTGDVSIAGRVFSNDAGANRDAEGLTLVGRDVSVEGAGRISAEQATLQIGAVGAGALDVPLDLRAAALGRGSAAGGRIRIEGGPAGTQVSTLSVNPDQGRIVLRGGELVVIDAALLAGGDGSTDPDAAAIDVGIAGRVSISGTTAKLESQSGASFGPGDVRIAADALELREGGSVDLTTNDGGPGVGRLAIDVERLEIEGQFSQLRSVTTTAGDGGAIEVVAREIRLREEGRIVSESIANASIDVGSSGAILLEADSIALESGADVLSVTNDAGTGGDVTVRAGTLSLVDRARIAAGSNSDAAGGDVRIEVGGLALAESSVIGTGPVPVGPLGETRPAGPAGSLTIVADSARVEGGSQLSTTTIGSGDAGDLQIDVRDALVLTGALDGADQPSGLFARSGEGFGSPATGDGGRVVVRAGRLEVSDGAQISATTVGSGRAGEIDVETAGDLRIDGGRISTFSADTGATGDLRLAAGRDLVLRNGAEITSEAPIPAPPGDPGDPPAAGGITLVAGELIRVEDARIATDSARPESGDVSLSAGTAIGLVASELTTNVDSSAGRGGDVTIETSALALAGAVVTANAAGTNADAGDVRLVARQAILQSPDSRVEARAELGVAGEIVRASPETNLAEELGRLAAEIPSEDAALLDPCEARRSNAGTFSQAAAPVATDSPEALLPLAPAAPEGDGQARDGCPGR